MKLRIVVPLALAMVFFALHLNQPSSDGYAEARQAQEQLLREVPAPVLAGPSLRPVARDVKPGRALAVMRIPRFGAEWEWTVVEGIRDSDLANGPGHYPQTPLPGQRGNAAVAGHRAGHGDPFIDFDLLRAGDKVIFTQGQTTWTYRITAPATIIDPEDVWVLNPLPGRWLTLTTCWPKYGSSHRMYVRAKLL
jgi:sortase A